MVLKLKTHAKSFSSVEENLKDNILICTITNAVRMLICSKMTDDLIHRLIPIFENKSWENILR